MTTEQATKAVNTCVNQLEIVSMSATRRAIAAIESVTQNTSISSDTLERLVRAKAELRIAEMLQKELKEFVSEPQNIYLLLGALERQLINKLEKVRHPTFYSGAFSNQIDAIELGVEVEFIQRVLETLKE